MRPPVERVPKSAEVRVLPAAPKEDAMPKCLEELVVDLLALAFVVSLLVSLMGR